MQILHNSAPDFEAQSTGFNPLQLYRDFANQALILYFYPKDFTPICTIETQYFKQTYIFFEKLNIKILGISKDNLDTHHRFKAEHDLPFDLVADDHSDIAKLYGVHDDFFDMTKRITYLLDNTHTIRGIYKSVFENKEGIENMVQQIQEEATKIVQKP